MASKCVNSQHSSILIVFSLYQQQWHLCTHPSMEQHYTKILLLIKTIAKWSSDSLNGTLQRKADGLPSLLLQRERERNAGNAGTFSVHKTMQQKNTGASVSANEREKLEKSFLSTVIDHKTIYCATTRDELKADVQTPFLEQKKVVTTKQ